MRAALLTGPRVFEFVEESVPTIAPDEVLVRVAVCTVCTSELHDWHEGPAQPRRLGHEVSGVIEAVGREVTTLRPGDKVALWATGKGYAEYVALKAEFCLPTGDVPLAQAALAEPLACAVNAVELANVRLGDDVAIVGAGFMGNLVQALVSMCGPRHVVVADTRPDALERAAMLGATLAVNVGTESLPDSLRALTGGEVADVSFEVTGSGAALAAMGEVTRMSGKIVIVGYHQGEERHLPLGYWNWMAYQILNAHFREVTTIMHGMRAGMRLLTSGRLDLGSLVTHRFPLEEIGRAFLVTHDKPSGFTKAAVVIDETLAPAIG